MVLPDDIVTKCIMTQVKILERQKLTTTLTILSEPEEEVGILKVVFIDHMVDVVSVNEKLT